ncbi:MAG: hypothetical protein E6R09_18915 [Rhodocyclaceae bacterium]|nr:MAG: hypothetical protein E6R09_18915 [Rhodocyclaceae bacterium]
MVSGRIDHVAGEEFTNKRNPLLDHSAAVGFLDFGPKKAATVALGGLCRPRRDIRRERQKITETEI